MPPIPPDFAQINAIWSGQGLPTGAQWTLAVGLDTFSGDPTDLAQAFEEWLLASNLDDVISNDVRVSAVLVKFGPDATGPSALEPANYPGVGGDQAAPNTAYLIHKNTADGGRAGRGRLYQPGAIEGSVADNGAVAGGTVTSLSAAFEAIRTAAIADGAIPMVLHGAGSPLSTPSPITSFSADSVVATQRRRLRR